MRKLTDDESDIYVRLLRYPDGVCIGAEPTASTAGLLSVFHSLVKKKRAVVEVTDDGPRFRALP